MQIGLPASVKLQRSPTGTQAHECKVQTDCSLILTCMVILACCNADGGRLNHTQLATTRSTCAGRAAFGAMPLQRCSRSHCCLRQYHYTSRSITTNNEILSRLGACVNIVQNMEVTWSQSHLVKGVPAKAAPGAWKAVITDCCTTKDLSDE